MGQINYSEGRLFLQANEWVLDAEPHVGTLFERLFPGSKTVTLSDWAVKECGYEYTHRPRHLNDTLSVRKDVLWFSQRYDLQISPEDKAWLEAGSKEYDALQRAAKEAFFESPPLDLPLALPLRDYQEKAVALALHRKSLLIADQVGLGKTPIGIALGSQRPPCLVVVPSHLVTQWRYEIKKFLPGATVATVKSGKQTIPEADFVVTSYNIVYKHTTALCTRRQPTTIVLDEVHSLRSKDTEKYRAISAISERAEYRIGLSATPIMNYGQELYNIFQILEPNALGDAGTFAREWCQEWGKIRDPVLLGNYLRKNLMMVRRTRSDVLRSLESVNRIAYTVDADLESLKALEKDAQVLALKVITGGFHESGEAARELDVMLRKATGVAKAKSVAEMVKVILESGEKVVLFGWHRDVYDIWLRELAPYHPVMYTGSESPKQKDDSLAAFIEGKSKVFLMSLRSGAGINGLQHASSYAVFGELDWSPGVIDQCIGRLWREGQDSQVTAMFITIDDGADPIMKKVIGMKTTEQQQIINPDAEVLAQTGDNEKIISLAKDLLERQGVNAQYLIDLKDQEARGDLRIPPPATESPAYPVYNVLRRAAFGIGKEAVLQADVERALQRTNLRYEREVRLSDESRVDFKSDDVLIECKTRGFSKTNLLRQIKKYKRDYPMVAAIIIVTPDKIHNFSLDGVPVYSINISDNSLLLGGLS